MCYLCTRKRQGALVQLVRIHACHAWGHGFESRTHRLMLFEKSSKRALSSAGSERLPYKQRVGGSNPSAPTNRILFEIQKKLYTDSSISIRTLSSAGSERLPYKQRVGGSNPSAPTSRQVQFALVFSFYLVSSFGRCSILSRFLCFRKWFRSYAMLSFAFIEGNVW